MNIAGMLLRSAARFPDRPAVSRGPHTVLSYRELARRASSLAYGMREDLGLQPGDRVGVVMPNVPEYLEILFAVWQAGLVAVPMNARLHGREIAYILESAGARACFVSPDTEPSVAPLPGAVPDLAHIVVTGGATYSEAADATTVCKWQKWPSVTRHGCSTPAARPAGRRARCSRTAISC